MGCASSSPLMEGSKNMMDSAKETASDIVHKGEQTMHEVGESAKDGFGNVKDAMASAMNTAENSIGSIVGKIGDTFHGKDEMITEMQGNAEETLAATADNVNEAISDAETIIASEVEAANDTVTQQLQTVSDELGETVAPVVEKIEETLHIEDVEGTPPPEPEASVPAEDATAPDDGTTVTPSAEEDATKEEVSSNQLEPEAEPEPAPTPWEAACDAILRQASSAAPSMDLQVHPDDEVIEGDVQLLSLESPTALAAKLTDVTTAAAATTELTIPTLFPEVQPVQSFGRHRQLTRDAGRIRMEDVDYNELEEYIDKDYDLCSGSEDYLLIDTLSLKSYKSEI